MTRSTMFGPAKNKYLRNIITLKNPLAARGAVRELNREFDDAATKPKKLRIARAAKLASNRAKASAKRKALSARERRQMKEIADIYARASERMFRTYNYL